MSHKVTISYEGLTIQIQAECDNAIHSLCKIDRVLEKIHNTANKLETSKVKEYERYLLKSKTLIKKKIEDFKKTLDQYRHLKKIGDFSVQNEYNEVRNRLTKQSSELAHIVSELTGSKLAVIDQMINDGLINAGQSLLEKSRGVINIDADLLNKINTIDDISLRELAYRELLNGENESFNTILRKAKSKYDILLEKKVNQVVNECKSELQTRGISSNIIENINSIDEATQITNQAIVDEKVRKDTLKIIIKSIRDRGFIVDTKKNLKIDRKNNIVKLVALKASGQKAEFDIQLSGKFMYHFDGYEGQACNKDITPFMDDLKNIYDINVLHEEVEWSNPDKIQAQKYQYVNKNKGTN